jgi:hypothetical protein
MGNGISAEPPAGHGTGQPPTYWQPPTAVEHQLYEAGESGDWPAYFATLAATDLFVPAARETVDAMPGQVSLSPFRDPQVDGLCQAVFTRGMLPQPVPGQVHERTELAWLARIWPSSLRWLAVNPGTPVETFVPAEPKSWKKYAKKAAPEPRLKTLWTGHLHDATAHGMACGALLLVNNEHLWNHLGWQGQGYSEEQGSLREWWDITSREQLLETQHGLLQGEYSPAVWEFVLRVRQALIAEYTAVPDAAVWREATERVLLARTAELVDATGRPPEFDLDADIALTQELIGRTLRYEGRFRADGILAEDAVVRSVLAWDFGRASAMARWGLGARFCELEETRQALLTAGSAGRQVYTSWPDFAAGYILGRCFHFDDEKFGTWYTEMVDVYRILTTTPESPWLTVPWTQPSDAAQH